MLRREVLNASAATGVAGAAGIQAVGSAPSSRTATSIDTTRAVAPWIEARDGTRLHWTQWGVGRPILFLNSAGASTQMWDYQMVAFADQGYRCIAFDRRGHGLSERPVGGYEYDTFADDVDSIIKTLDLRSVVVVTHSMGAGEIARYLTRHGRSRVARVVLVSPTTPLLGKSADNPNGVPKAAFDALYASWRKDFPKWFVHNADQFFNSETSVAMKQWGASLLMQCSLPVVIACNKATTSTDFRADLSRVSVPALVIHGDKDASAPLELTGKPTAELIPNCQFNVYRDAPHGLMYTHMEKLNADILQFIHDT